MGFHKRWICQDSICDRYRNSGMNSVWEWITNADAIICEDEFSSEIEEIIFSDGDETNRWNKASELICIKSLGIEKNSKESMTNCH